MRGNAEAVQHIDVSVLLEAPKQVPLSRDSGRKGRETTGF
jgi:hypothetical protein